MVGDLEGEFLAGDEEGTAGFFVAVIMFFLGVMIGFLRDDVVDDNGEEEELFLAVPDAQSLFVEAFEGLGADLDIELDTVAIASFVTPTVFVAVDASVSLPTVSKSLSLNSFVSTSPNRFLCS